MVSLRRERVTICSFTEREIGREKEITMTSLFIPKFRWSKNHRWEKYFLIFSWNAPLLIVTTAKAAKPRHSPQKHPALTELFDEFFSAGILKQSEKKEENSQCIFYMAKGMMSICQKNSQSVLLITVGRGHAIKDNTKTNLILPFTLFCIFSSSPIHCRISPCFERGQRFQFYSITLGFICNLF